MVTAWDLRPLLPCLLLALCLGRVSVLERKVEYALEVYT